MYIRMTLIPIVLVLGGMVGCNDSGTDGGKPKIAFVTNGIAGFWEIAEKGANDSAQAEEVDVVVKMPSAGVESQTQILQDLLTTGIDGVAISPIDPKNQGQFLREVAENTLLITHDSDAPDSNRICYVGMDNYEAGRLCGQLVKEAMPDGGSVMIFVGRLGQANAVHRRQGVIDELLDRSEDRDRFDPSDSGPLKGAKYTVLGTRTDDFDFQKAKSQVQDTIVKYPDIGCMVGLFEYNPPLMLEAVREAGKIDEIEIVGFDENADTLQAIKDGDCQGTVVQNPYRYGFESVKILSALARGDKSKLPEGGFLEIPARVIRKDNVEAFWSELNGLLGKEATQKSSASDTSVSE